MKNSRQQGEIVLDTFGGSGSTLILRRQIFGANDGKYASKMNAKSSDVIYSEVP